MENENTEDQSKINWLQRVQEQSWEPEILISGIILFALFQIPPYIHEAIFYLENYSILIFSGGTVDNTLGALLLTANSWLIIGFTTHLIGRSIWVAFVGMSYVYQDGINVSNLKYQKKFLEPIEKIRDYKALVKILERFCSRVFAVSFFLFMCGIGVVFFTLVIGLLISMAVEFVPNLDAYSTYINAVIGILGLTYLFDFVTLGVLKRIPIISRIYHPIYVVMSFLTLSPLYRSIYYGIVTNHKPWKVGLGMLAFAVITIVISLDVTDEGSYFNIMKLTIEGDEEQLYHGHYLNLAGDDPSQRIQIASDIVSENILRVFIVHRTQYEESAVMPNCAYEEHIQNETLDLDSLKLECLKSFYSLSLDGKEQPRDYLFHLSQAKNQSGLVSYIDISHLPKGMHHIELYYHFENEERPDPVKMATVEFYKTTTSAINHEQCKDETRE